MTDTVERQGRLEEVRTERRRRDDATIDGGQAMQLAVPLEIQQKLTSEGRTWRWANDIGNRLHRLTVLDDWDKVDGVPPVEVTTNKANGTTCKAFLLSKPIEFVEEDRAKKNVVRTQIEKQLLEGNVPATGEEPASRPDGMYLATDQRGGRGKPINKIERANQIISP